MIDLSDLLPKGFTPKKRARASHDLSDLIPRETREPEKLSDPLELELHVCETKCLCGAVYSTPTGAFTRHKHFALQGFGYRETGTVLLPVPARMDPHVIGEIPKTIRRTQVQITICLACVHTYARDIAPLGLPHLETPAPFSPPWTTWTSRFNTLSNEEMNEFKKAFEARESRKDHDTFVMTIPPSADPESQFEV
jgi:hypothetical protein